MRRIAIPVIKRVILMFAFSLSGRMFCLFKMSKESDFVTQKKDTDKSSVWYDYLTAKDGKSARCKKCGTVLKTLGGSTKALNSGKEESTQDIEVTESRDVGKQHCD
jgi:hypothetical protein